MEVMAPLMEESGLISSSGRFSIVTACSSGRAMVTPMLCPSSVMSASVVEVDSAEATCIYTCATVMPCCMAFARSTVR